jgi:hypothetical protein
VVRGEGLARRPLPERLEAYEAGGRQQGRWVLARDLRKGDAVLLRRGEVVALGSVRLEEVQERVYNFHVAGLQNYAVGGPGVLVHNKPQMNPPAGSNPGDPNPPKPSLTPIQREAAEIAQEMRRLRQTETWLEGHRQEAIRRGDEVMIRRDTEDLEVIRARLASLRIMLEGLGF